MASTSLTRSTAIEALAILASAQVLQELPNARLGGSYRSGRPARRFALSSDLGVVVGVDAGDTHLAVTVADARDTTLVHHRVDVDPAQTPAQRLSTVEKHLDGALAESGRRREDVLAL